MIWLIGSLIMFCIMTIPLLMQGCPLRLLVSYIKEDYKTVLFLCWFGGGVFKLLFIVLGSIFKLNLHYFI